MTLQVWALKVGELKPLSRGGLLLLAARCAIRVEPWLPPGADALWHLGLTHVAAVAFDAPAPSKPAAKLARELSNRGAKASSLLAATDEPLGQCMNYAALALGAAVEATSLDGGSTLKKAVLASAKLSASIAAVLGHAGRVRVPTGKDPVAVACVAIWDAIRADITSVAAASADLEIAKDRIRALREHAALWVGRPPRWASPR